MTPTASTTPSGNRIHWEDLEVGAVRIYGDYEVTKDEIFAYARAYDPQPHHVDEEAAKLSLTKGLCASGWHSCAMFMRLYFDGALRNAASMGAPGIDEVKWLKPVRPGHILRSRTMCVEKRVMRSRPGVGIARMRHEIVNQDDEVLMVVENPQLIGVRDPKAATALETPAAVAAAAKPAEPAIPPIVDAGPLTGNHFEDQVIGARKQLGSHTFTPDDIKRFAAKYDPQSFHMDEEAAKSSIFGGLCASGWHTAAEFIGHMIRARQAEEQALRDQGAPVAMWGPSPGFKNLKWPRPVMAGDTISFRVTILDKVDLKSRPERGLLVFLNEGINQNGQLAYQVTGQILVPRRSPRVPA